MRVLFMPNGAARRFHKEPQAVRGVMIGMERTNILARVREHGSLLGSKSDESGSRSMNWLIRRGSLESAVLEHVVHLDLKVVIPEQDIVLELASREEMRPHSNVASSSSKTAAMCPKRYARFTEGYMT